MTKIVAVAISAAGLVLCLSATPAHAVSAASGTCAQVEIIGARGTTELPGFGSTLEPLADELQSNAKATVGLYALPYPASFLPSYETSESDGVADLLSYLSTEARACPSQYFVLMGYSQGAQVVNDALASGEIPASIGSRILGVTTFGDPRFNSAEPFDAGTFTKGDNGILGPRPTGSERAYASVIQSYCNRADEFCQLGGTLVNHLTYVMTADPAAYTFLLPRIGG